MNMNVRSDNLEGQDELFMIKKVRIASSRICFVNVETLHASSNDFQMTG
jgi:hypothetical protein